MSPPVRILCVLILAVGLASGQWPALLAALAALAAAAWVLRRQGIAFDVGGWLRMLRRIRWLVLAILVMYGAFMPGEPVWPALGAWSPSWPGLEQGVLRMSALLGMVLAVHLLLRSTPRAALLAGLLWYGAPLRRLGWDDRPFATRLLLTLEAVPQVQEIARLALAQPTQGRRLQRWAQLGRAVLEAALERAETGPTQIEVPDRLSIPAHQWAWPLALSLLFLAAWTLV